MQYNKGDKVSLLIMFEGGICTMYGEVIQSIQTGIDLYYLQIKGRTSTGHDTRWHTYSDDKTLKILEHATV